MTNFSLWPWIPPVGYTHASYFPSRETLSTPRPIHCPCPPPPGPQPHSSASPYRDFFSQGRFPLLFSPSLPKSLGPAFGPHCGGGTALLKVPCVDPNAQVSGAVQCLCQTSSVNCSGDTLPVSEALVQVWFFNHLNIVGALSINSVLA